MRCTNSGYSQFFAAVAHDDTQIPVVFRKAKTGALKPLSHYLFDQDTTCLSKQSYSTSSKATLAQDQFAMETLFGSVEEGVNVLENITAAKWADLYL